MSSDMDEDKVEQSPKSFDVVTLFVEAKQLHEKGSRLYDHGRYSEAAVPLEEALAISRTLGDEILVSHILNTLGLLLLELGETTVALQRFQEVILLAKQSGNASLIAGSTHNIGMVYFAYSDYASALDWYQKAAELNRKTKHNAFLAKNISGIADVYCHLTDFERALENYQQALDIETQFGSPRGVAYNLIGIGDVYTRLLEFDTASNYINKALAIAEEISDSGRIVDCISLQGSIKAGAGHWAAAFEYYRLALEYAGKNGMKKMLANLLGNIGYVCGQLGEYKQALEYANRSIELYTDVEDLFSLANEYGNLGVIYAQREFDGFDPVKAEEHFLRALEIIYSKGNLTAQLEYEERLYKLYKYQQRWEDAFLYSEKAIETQRQIGSESSLTQARLMEFRRRIEESERDRQVKLARFQEQEKILHNILPSPIADRMIEGETTIVDSYDSVSVLFADIVGFTELSQRVIPEQLVAGLDAIFNSFDQLADKHGCEKIKTIGDCYMVVAGLPERCNDHAERLGAMALEMLKAIEELPALVENISISMRIGIHSGSVVAGIIGKNKYAYDLWGDAVNTASRMESHGEAGKIHVSEEFRTALISTALNELPIEFISRGEIEIKGKGMMKTYFLEKKI